MSENFLARLFEHNNWANQKTIEVCLTLTDEQLDVAPHLLQKAIFAVPCLISYRHNMVTYVS